MRFTPKPRGRGPSKHFTWREVTTRSGYPSMPLGPFKLPNGKWCFPRSSARKQAAQLEKLRAEINRRRRQHHLDETGISVLSWARSWSHNAEVGGASDSRHLYFQACDISVQEIDRLLPWRGGRFEFDTIAGAIFRDGGFGTYPAGNRHVDTRGYRARWSSWVPGRR